MASAGTITFTLDADNSKMLAALRQATGQTEKFAKKTKMGLSGAISSLTSLKAAFVGVAVSAPAVALFSVTNAASDLEEQVNLLNVTFGRNMKSVNSWGDAYSESVGLAKSEVLKLAGDFGAVLKPMTGSLDAATEMSKSFTQLAVDVASFRNLRVEDAFEKLRAGITGESEPLKQLGVVMNETALEAHALAKGFAVSYKDMDTAAKTAVRYSFIMDSLKDAQGDAINTSGSYANQTRKLGSVFKSLQEQVGTELLPTMNEFLTSSIAGLRAITPYAVQAAKALGALFRVIDKLTTKMSGFTDLFVKGARIAGTITKFLGKTLVPGGAMLSNAIEEEMKNSAQGPVKDNVADGVSAGISKGIDLADLNKLGGKLEEAMTFSLDEAIMNWNMGFDFGEDVGVRIGPSFSDFVQGAKEFNFGMESEAQRLERMAKASEMNAKLEQEMAASIRATREAAEQDYIDGLNKIDGRLGSVSQAFSKFTDGDYIGAFLSLLSNFAVFNQALELVSSTLDGVFGVVDELLQPISDLISMIEELVGAVLRTISTALKPLTMSLSVFSKMFEGIGGFLGKIFKKDAEDAAEALREITGVQRLAETFQAQLGVIGALGPSFNRVDGTTNNMLQTLQNTLTTDQWKDFGKAIEQEIENYRASLSAELLSAAPRQDWINTYELNIENLEEALALWQQAMTEGAGAASDAAGTLKDTASGMQEVLNAPAGLKLALHRFNAINGAQVGGMTQNQVASNLGSSTGVGRTINLMGDVIVNGVTDVDGLTKEIQHQTTIKETASEGATSYAETATGAGVGRRMP